MMSKPKYIVTLTGLFCSVVAGVLRTFTRFFSVNVLARVIFFFFFFGYDNYGLWPWQAKPRPKTVATPSFTYFILNYKAKKQRTKKKKKKKNTKQNGQLLFR